MLKIYIVKVQSLENKFIEHNMGWIIGVFGFSHALRLETKWGTIKEN